MIKKLEWDAINDNDEAIYFLREKVNEMADRLNEMETPVHNYNCLDRVEAKASHLACDCSCHHQEDKPQEEMVEVTISDGKGSYVANNKIVFLKVRYPKAKLLAALDSIK